MKGIVLVSHGDMAKGMAQSATLFFGENIEQLTYCCLQASDNPENFNEVIKEAINKVDTGDGVVIMADLFGGTPCNQSITLLNDSIELIAGMNFAMLLEVLATRFNEINIDSLVSTGQTGVCNVKIALQNSLDEDDE